MLPLAIVTIAWIAVASTRPVAAQEQPVPAPERARVDLRPGDRVRLSIWREPDLSGEYQVDERGEVVFPKLGAMRVIDLSADSLKQLLVHDYTAYLRDPSVEVTLLRRVNVLGSVRSPGLYQVDQTETIADVLAQAGGPTPDGKPDRVELRQGRRKHRHPPDPREPPLHLRGAIGRSALGSAAELVRPQLRCDGSGGDHCHGTDRRHSPEPLKTPCPASFPPRSTLGSPSGAQWIDLPWSPS